MFYIRFRKLIYLYLLVFKIHPLEQDALNKNFQVVVFQLCVNVNFVTNQKLI